MELQNFGWNAATIGFCGTIFFTIFSAWGLLQQAKKIWVTKSGQSVSVNAFGFAIFLFSANIIYGYSINSLALVFNGSLLGLLSLLILSGLAKFKGFTFTQKSLALLFFGLIIAMIILPSKGQFYLFFSLINIAAVITQPWEILRNKDAGAVEVRLVLVYLAGGLFWVSYAFAIHNLFLQLTCPIYLITNLTTLSLWLKYRVKQ